MAIEDSLLRMLHQLDRPAFLAEAGKIVAINEGAEKKMIKTDLSVSDCICLGLEEYLAFSGDGTLYLTLQFEGFSHSATVTTISGLQLFILTEDAIRQELQSLSLAAAHLSVPISELSVILSQIEDMEESQRAKLTRNLYRLQRIVGNMSDAAQLPDLRIQRHRRELGALLGEILEKARTLLSHKQITLDYRLPEAPVFAAVNEDLLRRAIYNLLSNAAKFDGRHITVSCRRKHERFYIQIADNGSGIRHAQAGNLFCRYTREPGLEDYRNGLGIGLSLVRTVVSAHGGTVLVESNPPAGSKVTISLSLKQSGATELRSPILTPDFYGGQDQALIELSDILPYELYIGL